MIIAHASRIADSRWNVCLDDGRGDTQDEVMGSRVVDVAKHMGATHVAWHHGLKTDGTVITHEPPLTVALKSYV